MERKKIKELKKYVGEEVLVSGWVHVRRDHGKLIFIDLRDASGKIQMVAIPSNKDAHGACERVRAEWVVSITGKVNKRPEKMINKNEENGDIEIEILGVEILNEAKTPPFEVSEDTSDVDEELRLKHRYLDLRTKRMHKNIRIRSEFVKATREYLFSEDFLEIETPLLTAPTLEGSRDFVVPSRIHPGKFYALPQSPQQYKQLLMSAGFERYFQIARAVRDEDLRADRGFEHSQIDIEMSFVDKSQVMKLIENMSIAVAEKMGYTIKEKPFPIITYADAMKKYGDDKMDLRAKNDVENGVLAYAWVVDFPLFERTDTGAWTFSHNPFSMPDEKYIDDLLAGKNTEKIISQQYDLVCNGYEVGGGSIRSHKPEILRAVYKIMGYDEEKTGESIGHMLNAFEYGTPPHGGIAIGVERSVMNLTGEDTLRDVQAFPMTRTGKTSVMNAPNNLNPEQLAELGIRVTKRKEK